MSLMYISFFFDCLYEVLQNFVEVGDVSFGLSIVNGISLCDIRLFLSRNCDCCGRALMWKTTYTRKHKASGDFGVSMALKACMDFVAGGVFW
jgi:hypothetical protein